MTVILIPFLLVIAISISISLINTKEIKLRITGITIQFIGLSLIFIIITNSILYSSHIGEVYDFIKNKHESYVSNIPEDCILDNPEKINLLKNEYILALESIQKEISSGYNQDIFKDNGFDYLLYNIGLFVSIVYDKNILGFEGFDHHFDILEKYLNDTGKICKLNKKIILIR